MLIPASYKRLDSGFGLLLLCRSARSAPALRETQDLSTVRRLSGFQTDAGDVDGFVRADDVLPLSLKFADEIDEEIILCGQRQIARRLALADQLGPLAEVPDFQDALRSGDAQPVVRMGGGRVGPEVVEVNQRSAAV